MNYYYWKSDSQTAENWCFQYTMKAPKDRLLMNVMLGLDSLALRTVMEMYDTIDNDYMILLKWDLALLLSYPLPSEHVNVF